MKSGWSPTSSGDIIHVQYVWSPHCVDELILRDRTTEAGFGGGDSLTSGEEGGVELDGAISGSPGVPDERIQEVLS